MCFSHQCRLQLSRRHSVQLARVQVALQDTKVCVGQWS